MKRIGFFVDVSNLYYCVGKKYNKRKLDYRKYLEFVQGLGEVQQAIAYGAHVKDEASGFEYCLKCIGFATKYKIAKTYKNDGNFRRKADHDVTIAIDIVNMVDSLDMIILGSADGDLVPAVEWARAKGKDVVTFACGISRDLKEASTKFIEIPESLLEAKKISKGTTTTKE